MAYYHVTSAGAGTKSGASWANAMGVAEFKTSIEAATAGDTYWIKGYTDTTVYTLTSTIDSSAQDGTAIEPISIIGVKNATTHENANVTQSDWATLTERPKFDGGTSYRLTVGNYYIIRNIQVVSALTHTLLLGQKDFVENCRFENDVSSDSTADALLGSTSCKIVNCEITAPYGYGAGYATSVTYDFCYFHDINAPGNLAIKAGSNNIFTNCIFDNCTTGIYLASYNNLLIQNCTFYDCDTGISGTTAYAVTCINNIFSTCGTAISWTTQTDSNFFRKNHFYNNTTDFSGVDVTGQYQDYEKTTGDPKFGNPASGDFTLDSDSPCIDAGMSITLGTG